MSYLIPISGTHGCGKSTLVALLGEEGWTVDKYQVSRDVQKNVFAVDSLSEVLTNPYAVMAFQEMILRKKLKNDQKIRLLQIRSRGTLNDMVVFTERSFVDIAAYAALWLTKFNNHTVYMRWLSDYVKACAQYQRNLYGANVYLNPIEHWEEDPNRANKEDREFINTFMLDFMRENNVQQLSITGNTPKDRADCVKKQVALLLNTETENEFTHKTIS